MRSKSPPPPPAAKPVEDEVRVLAYDDLLRALIQSNRDLVQTYQLRTGLLKSSSQLRALAQNTERSVFAYNGTDIKTYAESVLTLLIALTDPSVARHAVLFRFLANAELDDLFLGPSSVEILFAELCYADVRPSVRHYALDKVAQGIARCVPFVLYDYMNGQPYTHLNGVQLSVPRIAVHAMTKYREQHLGAIKARLTLNAREAGYESDAVSVASSSAPSSASSSSVVSQVSRAVSSALGSASDFFGRLFGEESGSSSGTSVSRAGSSSSSSGTSASRAGSGTSARSLSAPPVAFHAAAPTGSLSSRSGAPPVLGSFVPIEDDDNSDSDFSSIPDVVLRDFDETDELDVDTDGGDRGADEYRAADDEDNDDDDDDDNDDDDNDEDNDEEDDDSIRAPANSVKSICLDASSASSSSSSSSRASSASSSCPACHACRRALRAPTNYRTVILQSGTPRTILFCNQKCMENWDFE
jgi:hypothetical protein